LCVGQTGTPQFLLSSYSHSAHSPIPTFLVLTLCTLPNSYFPRTHTLHTPQFILSSYSHSAHLLVYICNTHFMNVVWCLGFWLRCRCRGRRREANTPPTNPATFFHPVAMTTSPPAALAGVKTEIPTTALRIKAAPCLAYLRTSIAPDIVR
jgi:hypothetical protein